MISTYTNIYPKYMKFYSNAPRIPPGQPIGLFSWGSGPLRGPPGGQVPGTPGTRFCTIAVLMGFPIEIHRTRFQEPRHKYQYIPRGGFP